MKTTTMLLPIALFSLTACASRDQAGTTVTTVPTGQGQQVIMVEPGASARGEVRHTVTGKVEGIDRNAGEITVKTADGSKTKVKLPPLAAANVRDGDDVSLNVVVRPRP